MVLLRLKLRICLCVAHTHSLIVVLSANEQRSRISADQLICLRWSSDRDDRFKGPRVEDLVGRMIAVVPTGMDVARLEPAIRLKEAQAEELLPDFGSVCEIDDHAALTQAIAILPVCGKFLPVRQGENAGLSICERVLADGGEDSLAKQASAVGLDITVEYPCPAEIPQDLRARRQEGATVTSASGRPCCGRSSKAAREMPPAEPHPSAGTVPGQQRLLGSRRRSAPRHRGW